MVTLKPVPEPHQPHTDGSSAPLQPGPVQAVKGRLEGVREAILIGWALSTQSLAERRLIEILEGDQVIAQGLADSPRKDLATRGIGDGRYGFQIALPTRLHDGQPHRLWARDRASRTPLLGDVTVTQPKLVIGAIDGIADGHVFGWVPGEHGSPPDIEFQVDGQCVGRATAKLARPDMYSNREDLRIWGFSCDLGQALEQATAPVLTALHAGLGLHLGNSPMDIRTHAAFGSVDQISGPDMRGWVCLAARQAGPATLEIWVDGQQVDTVTARKMRPDLCRIGLPQSRCGFHAVLPERFQDGLTHEVEIRPAGIETPLRKGRFTLSVDREEQVSGSLPDTAADPAEPLAHPQVTRRPHPPTCDANPVTDIIIPVYGGREETLDCLRSLLDTVDATPREIIVINDRSPDEALTAALRELAASTQAFTLLENPTNLGFVGTVNRGMRCHPERDVILLNADTVVPRGDWITRLRHTALASPDIATATPFSNRATLCSLPLIDVDNALIPGQSVDDIDARCRDANPRQFVDIPTGVGSCMYIRRPALEATGYFNEGTWGRGYAEENEFCIRSAAMGWRHVAACDIFIQHHGAVSFRAEKGRLIQRNLALLHRAYPGYQPEVHRFLEEDPLAAARARVVLPILRSRAPRYLLHILHDWGGGTPAHVRDLCRRLAADGESCLLLRPGRYGAIELSDTSDDLAMTFPRHVPMFEVAEALKTLGVWHIHFHQTIGLPLEVWDLPALCGTGYDITVHDHYLACPRINLLNHDNRFCGQPTLADCEHCLNQPPLLRERIANTLAAAGGSVKGWRARNAVHLSQARRVIAPSHDTAQRLRQFFPSVAVSVQAHPEPPLSVTLGFAPPDVLRVAIIGAIGEHKGHAELLATARLALAHQLPIQFLVVGFTCDNEAYEDLINLDMLGHYKPEELPDLLDLAQCQVALFLSPWPETFSYALTEAWRAGLVPVVTGLGAQAERVLHHEAGVVMSAAPDAAEVVDTLLQLRSHGWGPKRLELKASYEPGASASFLQSYYGLTEPAETT